MELIFIAILFVITLVSSSSHIGICVGPAVGSGFLNKRHAITIYVTMLSLGALTQGYLMSKAVTNASICSLATATAIAIAPSLVGIPLSLNFALYTSQIGCSLKINLIPLATECLWWSSLLLTTGILSVLVAKITMKLTSGSRSPIRVLKVSRIIVIIFSCLMSFVVGANTFGFLMGFSKDHALSRALLILAIVLGPLLVKSKSIERIAYRFYRIGLSHALTCYLVSITLIELATLASVPLPASLTMVTSLYTASLAAPVRLVRLKNYLNYVILQTLSIPLALALGALIALIGIK